MVYPEYDDMSPQYHFVHLGSQAYEQRDVAKRILGAGLRCWGSRERGGMGTTQSRGDPGSNDLIDKPPDKS
jgi:hypothetical protein